jgi:hypothetical protein
MGILIITTGLIAVWFIYYYMILNPFSKDVEELERKMFEKVWGKKE